MTDATRALLVWIGLAIASSPALTNLFRSLRDEPSQRYALLALLLLILLISREPRSPSRPPPRWGWILLAVGLSAQLLGVASASRTILQLGLSVSVFGAAAALGRPSLRSWLLVFGLVPVPIFVQAIGSPGVESFLAAIAGRFLDGLGLVVDVGGPLIRTPSGRFELVASDGGIITGICAAEFAWFRSVRAGDESKLGARRAALAGVLGIALQPLLVCVTATALPLGAPDVGRFVLSHGVPLALAIAVLASEAKRR